MRHIVKNLIYQYWDGNLVPGIEASVSNIAQYAKRIGADHLFEKNPRFVTNLGSYSPHYGSFKPIYDESFHEYDNVLFLDADIFAVDGLSENIFEGFEHDIGICTEPLQPNLRKQAVGRITSASDELWASTVRKKWNVDMPRNEQGLLKVYNSGVVLYSNKGLLNAKKKFVPFKEYVNLIKATRGLETFYTADQNYIHAMLEVANMDWVELDNEWNSLVHWMRDPKTGKKELHDPKTKNTKFVHIQAAGISNYDVETHWKITNLPKDKWDFKWL